MKTQSCNIDTISLQFPKSILFELFKFRAILVILLGDILKTCPSHRRRPFLLLTESKKLTREGQLQSFGQIMSDFVFLTNSNLKINEKSKKDKELGPEQPDVATKLVYPVIYYNLIFLSHSPYRGDESRSSPFIQP